MALLRFEGATLSELSHVTFCVGFCWEVPDLQRIIEKGHRDLRNRVHSVRRTDHRWEDIGIAGYWQIEAEPVPSAEFATWSVRAHLLIGRSEIDESEVVATLVEQWPDGQVSIATDGCTDAASLIRRTVAKANIPGFVQGHAWDSRWVSDLYRWLHSHRRSVFEFLRFSIEPAHGPKGREAKYASTEDNNWGVMPTII